jgi:hypothetical protein
VEAMLGLFDLIGLFISREKHTAKPVILAETP